MTQQAVQKWEKGSNEPSFETLTRIAGYFGVSTDCLLSQPPTGESPASLLAFQYPEWLPVIEKAISAKITPEQIQAMITLYIGLQH